MKTIPFRRKVIVSQTARPVRRTSGARHARDAAAQVEPGRDGRDDAGDAERLGRQEGGVGRSSEIVISTGVSSIRSRTCADDEAHRQADRGAAHQGAGEA